MKIQLVSFAADLDYLKRRNAVRKILNETDADVVLFPGATLQSPHDWQIIKKGVDSKAIAVLELDEMTRHFDDAVRYSLFLYQSGRLMDLYSDQMFSRSSHLSERVMDIYLNYELPRKRFSVGNKHALVLQCGENNIIRTPRSAGYRAQFRYQESEGLAAAYRKLMRKTDIIFNPMHTMQHRHFHERCRFLSEEAGYYFGTANADDKVKLGPALQVAYHNGLRLPHVGDPIKTDAYFSSTYII